jgi:hypothetical protein
MVDLIIITSFGNLIKKCNSAKFAQLFNFRQNFLRICVIQKKTRLFFKVGNFRSRKFLTLQTLQTLQTLDFADFADFRLCRLYTLQIVLILQHSI